MINFRKIARIIFNIILAVSVTVYSSQVIAQEVVSESADSLIMLLMNDNKDAEKVDVYTQLSTEYLSINYDQSIEYSLLGLELSEEINYVEGKLASKLALAHIYTVFVLDYGKGKKYYEDALKLSQSLNDKTSEIRSYRGLGFINGALSNYETAISYNKKALDLANELNDYVLVSDLNAYLGGLYEEIGETIKAIDYYNEVLAIERENDFKSTPNASMIAVARYYLLTNDHNQALKYYRIALKSFERMKEIRWLAYTHAQMSSLYLMQEDIVKAEQHALRGLELAQTNRLRKEIGDNQLALIAVYEKTGNLEKIEQYQKAYNELMDSLELDKIAELPELPTSNPEKKPLYEIKATYSFSGFFQAILICLPVILLLLLMGMPSRKK